jgi:demethylmenaquinone methyltransferase / 2-methoxy-6-polyprenyl-1,4-benzoquinol methylase
MLIRPFYNLFSFTVIPRLGAWIARAPEAYTYLVESIRRFPDQRAFEALIAAAGFGDVRWRNLSFGIACIHVGTRVEGLQGGAVPGPPPEAVEPSGGAPLARTR